MQVDTADLLVLSINTAPLLAPASLPLRQVRATTLSGHTVSPRAWDGTAKGLSAGPTLSHCDIGAWTRCLSCNQLLEVQGPEIFDSRMSCSQPLQRGSHLQIQHLEFCTSTQPMLAMQGMEMDPPIYPGELMRRLVLTALTAQPQPGDQAADQVCMPACLHWRWSCLLHHDAACQLVAVSTGGTARPCAAHCWLERLLLREVNCLDHEQAAALAQPG